MGTGGEEASPTPPAGEHAGHGGAPPGSPSTSPADKEKLELAEKAAYERARPIFEKHCARCHSSAGKKVKPKALEHISMDTYPFGGHHAADAGEEVRQVLGLTGEDATMPMDDPGAVTGDDLRVVDEWAKAFQASKAAGLHQEGATGHEGHGGH